MADHEAGLAAIYANERVALLRFLAARTGSAAEAEDIVQELWLKLGAVPAGPIGNPRAYLYRMAQNLVLDRLREQRRRAARDQSFSDEATGYAAGGTDPVDPGDTAEQQLMAREDVERLKRAIATLPEGAQRVLRLHKLEGLSHGDVAARLGISRSGVEKHMAAAMAHLRRVLRELG